MQARFAVGELSYSKVRAITRVATPETEQVLVNLARHATGGQLERLVRGYRGVLATIDGAQAANERRAASWRWEDDGTLTLRARLPADEGALLIAALEGAAGPVRSSRPERDEDDETGPPPQPTIPAHERCANGLVAMARASMAAGEAPRVGGDPCEIVVHVDAETLAGDEAGERSELAAGPALAPETVRRLGCDAAIVRIVERDGNPLSVGRRTRAVPAALRRALRSRDGGCRFPGCTHERFLHAHHIRHWARGGPTNLENLVQLCSFHHRLVHEGGFAVEPAGRRGVRFRRPDGRVIPPVAAAGRAVRAGPRDLAARQRVEGVSIDDRACRAVSAGDSLDYSIAVDVLLGERAMAAG